MSKKFRIFQVHPSDRCYQGSVWDKPVKPWVPVKAKQLTEFHVDEGRCWMSISEEEYQEVQRIRTEKAKKHNKVVIDPIELVKQFKQYTFTAKSDNPEDDEVLINLGDVEKVLTEVINMEGINI